MCKYCELNKTGGVDDLLPSKTIEFNRIKTIEFTVDKEILSYLPGKRQDINIVDTDMDVSICLDLREDIKNRNFILFVYKNIYGDNGDDLIDDDAMFIDLNFNYCPMCGRSLKEEKENESEKD